MNLQVIHRHAIGRHDERSARDRRGGGHDERIGLQRRVFRFCPAGVFSRGTVGFRRPVGAEIVAWLNRMGGLLFDQQVQQFDGIELLRRRRQRRGPEDAQQLRCASAPVLRQHMQHGKGEDHPGPGPMQHRDVVGGVKSEIEKAAADQ